VRLQALPRKQAAIGDVGAGAFTGGGDLASPFSSSHSAASQLRSALASAPCPTTLFYAPKLGLVGQTGPQRYHVLEVWAKMMKLTTGLTISSNFRILPPFILSDYTTISIQNKKNCDLHLSVEIGLQLLFY
jgi:hypothetical protein